MENILSLVPIEERTQGAENSQRNEMKNPPVFKAKVALAELPRI
jgi:hypothetical protein